MSSARDVTPGGRPIAEWSGVRFALGRAKLSLARCVLAIRRGDRLAAESLAVDAQIALSAAEIAADDLTRGAR